jgi:hypothetical protein
MLCLLTEEMSDARIRRPLLLHSAANECAHLGAMRSSYPRRKRRSCLVSPTACATEHTSFSTKAIYFNRIAARLQPCILTGTNVGGQYATGNHIHGCSWRVGFLSGRGPGSRRIYFRAGFPDLFQRSRDAPTSSGRLSVSASQDQVRAALKPVVGGQWSVASISASLVSDWPGVLNDGDGRERHNSLEARAPSPVPHDA